VIAFENQGRTNEEFVGTIEESTADPVASVDAPEADSDNLEYFKKLAEQ
jgi:hypothetical protein